ncbi:MAG: hypothetical protein R2799_06245 [Crocinitomicaceae bacterium]|nr:hypothetical protein [Crocinitomicaceae bacterium]
MKKLFLIPVLGMVLLSCGAEDEKENANSWDVCKCHTEMEKVEKEIRENGGSEDLKNRTMEIVENCNKIQEEMGAEAFEAKRAECLK